MQTPTLRELLADASFYQTVAVVYAVMASVISLVYLFLRRRRRNRRRSRRSYYGPPGQ